MLEEPLPHDIHDYAKRLEQALVTLNVDPDVSQENRETVLEYVHFRATRGLSISRQVRYIFTLRKLSKFLKRKEFEAAVKQDLVDVVNQIDNEKTKLETKRTEKECIKCFYRWLVNRREKNDDGDGDDREYPRLVKWIKTSRKKNQDILPENILTEEEVKRMVEEANNPRDKAIILLNYETGGRVGETLPLSLGDLSFDKYGAVLRVSGKTGGRRIRIIFSAKTLAEWLNHHPAKDDPNAPIWTSFDKVGSLERLKYAALRKMLKTTAIRAKVTKRTSPKFFRHARATNLANDLTEMQMREYFGWSKESDMPAIYVHLSGRNVDNALFKINGIKTGEEVDKEQRPLKVQQCSRCNEINSPTNRFCSKCGSPLDLQTALEVDREQQVTDEMMDRLFEDDRFKLLVEQLLKERQNVQPESQTITISSKRSFR